MIEYGDSVVKDWINNLSNQTLGEPNLETDILWHDRFEEADCNGTYSREPIQLDFCYSADAATGKYTYDSDTKTITFSTWDGPDSACKGDPIDHYDYENNQCLNVRPGFSAKYFVEPKSYE